MKAELVPDNDDAPIPILKDVTVIGRKPCCDVVIDHHSLSKRHAVVVKTDGLLVIRDLATTNGTKVKGQKIRWAALLPNDRITLGGYKMRVYLGPDHVPAPSERDRPVKAKRTSAPLATRPTRKTVPPLEIPPEKAGSGDDDSDSDSLWRQLVSPKPDPDGAENLLVDLD